MINREGKPLQLFTVEEVRSFLEAQVKEVGSIGAWAHKYGYTKEYVRMLLKGNETISISVARILGLKRVVYYEVIKDE